MRVVSEQQNSTLLALVPEADFEPILIRDAEQDRAVVLSPQRSLELAQARSREFGRIAEAVSARVAAAGLTEQDVQDILAESKAERIQQR